MRETTGPWGKVTAYVLAAIVGGINLVLYILSSERPAWWAVIFVSMLLIGVGGGLIELLRIRRSAERARR